MRVFVVVFVLLSGLLAAQEQTPEQRQDAEQKLLLAQLEALKQENEDLRKSAVTLTKAERAARDAAAIDATLAAARAQWATRCRAQGARWAALFSTVDGKTVTSIGCVGK